MKVITQRNKALRKNLMKYARNPKVQILDPELTGVDMEINALRIF